MTGGGDHDELQPADAHSVTVGQVVMACPDGPHGPQRRSGALGERHGRLRMVGVVMGEQH